MYRRATRTHFFSTARALRNEPRVGTVPPVAAPGGVPPAAKVETVISAGKSGIPPPLPPAGRPKPKRRFRRFLFGTTLLVATVYGAGIYLSLDNDTVYDNFTMYAPFGSTLVSLAEDWRLRSRVYVPDKNATKIHVRDTVAPDIARGNKNVRLHSDDVAHVGPTGGVVPSKSESKQKPASSLNKPAANAVSDKSGGRPTPQAGSTKSASRPSTAAALPVLNAPSDLDPSLSSVVDTVNEWVAAANKATLGDAQVKKMVETLTAVSSKISDLRSAQSKEIEKKLSEQANRFADALNAQISDLIAEFESNRKYMLEVYNKRLAKEVAATKNAVIAEANNRLQSQHVSLTSKFTKQISDLVEQERDGRLAKLNELTSNLSNLESTVATTGEAIAGNDDVVNFFVALGNLEHNLQGEARPLRSAFAGVQKTLPEDPLVKAAIGSLSDDVLEYGVLSHSQLAARFALIAPEIRRASLAPEDAGVAGHVGSWLLSNLLVKKSGMPKGDDIESVLARTETLLSQGKVVDAVSEVNSLRGWPREIASDWLREGRKRGEVEFVVRALAEEGRLSSMSLGEK